MDVGSVYGSYYETAKSYMGLRKEEKQAGSAEKVTDKSQVSSEDMTLEEYKEYFNEKMSGLYPHPSQRGMNWVIDITDAAYTQGMKENDGYSGRSSAKGTDAGRQKKARQKELLEEYLEKRAQAKKQQLEMLNKKIAKMELERSRQTQSWNSERQMAKASNAYDANIMMEAELVKNITKGENNGNFK